MKNPRHMGRHGSAAFTLVEMLAVITIIVILAAVVVRGMSFVTEKQAAEKAKIQVALLCKALEEYKSEQGSYPATQDTVDGKGQSDILFKALYWDSDNDGEGAAVGSGKGDEDQKVYLQDLDPTSKAQGWTSGTANAKTKILDPWGNEFRYRSAKGPSNGSTAASPNQNTQNPDFDLWSAGKDGKSKPEKQDDKSNNDDIKQTT